MSLILYILLASMILAFVSGLFSCFCIAKQSDEQSERLLTLLINEEGGSAKLMQQNIEHFFTAYKKIA
jgi:hypothetical protein